MPTAKNSNFSESLLTTLRQYEPHPIGPWSWTGYEEIRNPDESVRQHGPTCPCELCARAAGNFQDGEYLTKCELMEEPFMMDTQGLGPADKVASPRQGKCPKVKSSHAMIVLKARIHSFQTCQRILKKQGHVTYGQKDYRLRRGWTKVTQRSTPMKCACCIIEAIHG